MVKVENITRQLNRLNQLTTKTYHIIQDQPIMVDTRYCLLDENQEEITPWLKIVEFYDCMYSMIRLQLYEQDRSITDGDLTW